LWLASVSSFSMTIGSTPNVPSPRVGGGKSDERGL